MNSKNEAINDNIQYKTEEDKIKEKFNSSVRNKILYQNKNKSNINPIKALNNKSSFQIKPKNGMSAYKLFNKMKLFYGERKINKIYFNLKKNANSNRENDEEKDSLIIQIYHTKTDINQIDKEIKEYQNLFIQAQKENIAHKFIISKILQENQKVKVLNNFENYKNRSMEQDDSINKSKNSTIKVSSVKKGFFSKNYNLLEKNKTRTIPNSIRRVKLKDPNELKIGTLKKELNFYQKMIESKEEKLKKFNKKEGTMIYKDINIKIKQKNKNYENLNKINQEMMNKLFISEEKIFDLNQKLCKLKDKTNKYIEQIELYKNKISELEFKINFLTTERTKRQKQEKENEIQKSKEESELNSLLNEKKILEEKYIKKKELKNEQNDYKRELENSYREEKKYKLKKEVNLLKLQHFKKKNEELNQKVEIYEKERNNLLEKSKVPRKNKIKIEEMENELEKIIEEVEMYENELYNINKIIEEKNKKNQEINN